MNNNIKKFIKAFAKEIKEENAAIFAGAGLSQPAGYVNWKDLLRSAAEDIDLDVDKEHDLISLAQYHCNQHGGNRGKLNQILLEKLSTSAIPTENHMILARLPIKTYWTTNYDPLIEDSLRDAGKLPDVKYTTPQLALTKPRRDAVVYKMHGDSEHPDKAILIKDDYEKYHITHTAFLNALSGDLVSKTFLFIGFSFSDPNLDYVLSRIRIAFNQDQRTHYCILKEININDFKSKEEFEYAKNKQHLMIEDFRRYNIKTLLVQEYDEITQMLLKIEERHKQDKVFISGSATEYGDWGKEQAESFLFNLSQRLTENEFTLVSGFGLGIGNPIISGSINQIHKTRNGHIEDSLIIRPFPQITDKATDLKETWEKYRQETISTTGVCIILFGNKEQDGKTVSANGVMREYEIAKQHGLAIVPVGATGYCAEEIWNTLNKDLPEYYPGERISEIREIYQQLGDKARAPDALIDSIIKFIKLIIKD